MMAGAGYARRGAGAVGDKPLIAQPGQQIAADLLAEDVGEAGPVDRLVIGDGTKHRHLRLRKLQ